MNWITIKLMQYQLKKAKKQLLHNRSSFSKRVMNDLIKSYKTAIMFLEANRNN
jgi:hypothetical protein